MASENLLIPSTPEIAEPETSLAVPPWKVTGVSHVMSGSEGVGLCPLSPEQPKQPKQPERREIILTYFSDPDEIIKSGYGEITMLDWNKREAEKWQKKGRNIDIATRQEDGWIALRGYVED